MKGEIALLERKVSVVVRTAAEDEVHEFDAATRLVDACRLLRIPPNAISPFAELGDSTHRAVGIFRPLGDLVPEVDCRLILQFDRNLNYRALLSEAEQDPAIPPHPIAEYTFSSGNWARATHVQLDVESCRAFVAESIDDFVDQHPDIFRSGARVVVGTSGGGDSNALLTALAHSTAGKGVDLVPVMLLGIPEWDQAAGRAKRICKELGLELTLVSSDEVNATLGRPAQAPDWFSDFKQAFPLEDGDVIIGTLAIRLGLSRAAREQKAACVVTGLNLEDLLAECFLRVMQGRQPLEFPVRHLDDVTFCYPVYKVPKKILDGCHPKFALQNYKERSIGVTMGRGIPYLLAQAMNALIPGVEFDLIEGFVSLVHEWPESSSAFGFATISGDEVPESLRQRWSDYTDGRAPAGA